MREINRSLFKKHSPRQSETDSGSSESQIALFTHRINCIATHLKEHRKDHASRLGLIKIVQKRKKHLRYLERKNIDQYRLVCKNLSLRK